MQKIEQNKTVWLNVPSPNTKDLLFLKEEFKLNIAVLEQLPIPIKIITSSAILTIYQEPNPVLENFFDSLLHRPFIREEYFKGPDYLLFSILDKLIDSCLPMLDHIYEHIEEIEDKTFKGQEREMLSEISIVKRDIIDFRRTVKPKRSVLEILAKKTSRFFGQDIDFLSQEVIGSNIRVWNTLENHKELIEAIEKTNESLLSYKISNIMKILTLLSFITFPLSLIASIFAMNTAFNYSLIKEPLAFPLIMGSMIITVLLMYIWFKKKKWL